MFHYLRTGLESRNKNVDRYKRWSQNSSKIKDKNKGKSKTKSENKSKELDKDQEWEQGQGGWRRVLPWGSRAS